MEKYIYETSEEQKQRNEREWKLIKEFSARCTIRDPHPFVPEQKKDKQSDDDNGGYTLFGIKY